MRSASRLLGAQPTPLADWTYELGIKRHCLTVEGACPLTLIGPVEVGKTRFALAAADAKVTDHFLEVPRWYRVGWRARSA
jgi:hypothetical protein